MAYSYDQVFAADPANPSNIARNAAITIYQPGDPTKTPLVITDPSGGALSNPIPVNANGFGSAFMHATLDRVAWDGGGFTGFFTSYDGMKNEAVDARTAAQAAAATAGAEASAIATAAIGDATAEATAAAADAATAQAAAAASATAAANSAALVGAPADSAIAAAVTGNGATKTALNATYATKVTGGYLPIADAEANYAQLSSLAATFRPATTRQQAPVETVVTAFQASHGWTTTGAGATWDLNYTADAFAGSQCVRATTLGTGVEGGVQRFGFTPTIDLTTRVMVLPVKIVSGLANLSEIRVLLSNNSFTANSALRLIDGNSSTQVIREGEWFNFRFTLADVTSTSGTPDLTLTNSVRLTVKDKGTGVSVVQFGKFSYYTPPSSTQYPNGAVTLWFDDSYVSHRTIAAPYMARYGFPGSAAIICDKIDSSGMTLAQVKQLAEVYGWEINPHSYTVASHAAGYDSMTEQQLVDEVNSIKSWMAGNGFGANDHFAYPLGRHSALTDKVIGRYFSTARTTKSQPLETMLTGNRLRTRCFATTNTTTLADIQAVVDRAFRAGVWLQIYFHDILESGASTTTQMNRSVFESIIDYLNTKGCKVMSAGDVWNAGL